MRDAFSVPRASHRYLIEELSEHLHRMVMLSSRFLKFHQSLQKCSKSSVRYLCQLSSQNERTSYCQNLNRIAEKVNIGIDALSCTKIKSTMRYHEVPQEQKWRVALIKDMLECRWNTLEIDVVNDEVEDMDAFIGNLCVM